MGELGGSIRGFGGYLNGWIIYQEGAEPWFWDLGRDSPVLGRGYPFLNGFSQVDRAGSWF